MVLMFGVATVAASAAGGMLRFGNGDQLHGKYQGIGKNGELMWQRDDLAEEVAFKIVSIDQSGTLLLEAKHGAFDFPLAEVWFARNRSVARSDHASAGLMVMRFAPIGVISGKPEYEDAKRIAIKHSIFWVLDLSLESAVMLDFTGSKHLVDEWDGEFR